MVWCVWCVILILYFSVICFYFSVRFVSTLSYYMKLFSSFCHCRPNRNLMCVGFINSMPSICVLSSDNCAWVSIIPVIIFNHIHITPPSPCIYARHTLQIQILSCPYNDACFFLQICIVHLGHNHRYE